MNALMIALALRLGGARICVQRVLLGAVCGAAIAQASLGLSRMQILLMWIPTAMIMMCIARGRTAHRHKFSGTALLMCASGLAGGIILALWGATGSLFAAYVLGGMAVVGIGICAAHTRRAAQETTHVRMICTYRGGSAAFEAMIDSGNTLRDYLTHLPVIVLSERAGREALGLADSPLRPIFAQTAGGKQKMYVFAPETIAVEMDGVRHTVQAVIALSPKMSESVPALVPVSLLDRLWNSNRGG